MEDSSALKMSTFQFLVAVLYTSRTWLVHSLVFLNSGHVLKMNLRKELRLDLTEQHHHEISVDELKILSEEELVEKAFQASLKGGANFTRDSSEECSDGATNSSSTVDADVACSVKSGIDEDYVPSNNLPKRSRRTRNNGKFGMLLRRAKE